MNLLDDRNIKHTFICDGGLIFKVAQDEGRGLALLSDHLYKQLRFESLNLDDIYRGSLDDLAELLKEKLNSFVDVSDERGLTAEEQKIMKYTHDELVTYLESIKNPQIFNIPDKIVVSNGDEYEVVCIDTNDGRYLGDATFLRIPRFVNKHLPPRGFALAFVNELSLIKYLCEGLEKITVSPENESFTEYEGIVYSKDMKILYACPTGIEGCIQIPEGVETIGSMAFRFCSRITGIKLPDSLRAIESEAFSYSGIVSIQIPELVETIPIWTFQHCQKLEKIHLHNVQTIEHGAFDDCINLKTVIGHNVREILCHAFLSCKSIEEFQVLDNVEYDDMSGYSFMKASLHVQNHFPYGSGSIYEMDDKNQKKKIKTSLKRDLS